MPKAAKRELSPKEVGRLEQLAPDESCQRLVTAGLKITAWDWVPNRRTLRGLLPDVAGGRDDCRLPLLSFEIDGRRRFFPRGTQRDFLQTAAVNGAAIWRRMGELEGTRLFEARLDTLLFPRSFSLRRLQRRRITRLDDVRLRRCEADGGGLTCLPADLMHRLAPNAKRDTTALGRFQKIFCSTNEMPESCRLVFVLFDLACEEVCETNVTEDTLRSLQESALPRMVIRHRRPPSVTPDVFEALGREMWDALKGHLDCPSEEFQRWFYGEKDGYLDQLSRRKLVVAGQPGDPAAISRSVAHWHAEQLLYRSYHTVSWLVHGQMLAVEPLIAPELTEDERRYWQLWYHAQPVLGRQALIVLHHLHDLAFATTEAFAEKWWGTSERSALTEDQLWAAFLRSVSWLWEISFNRRAADVRKKSNSRLGIVRQGFEQPRKLGRKRKPSDDPEDDDVEDDDREYNNHSSDDLLDDEGF